MGRYVENLGVRIWTQSFGSRADKAILLISGAMAPAIFWNSNFCERLADLGYFVLRFDSRDIGDSTHFPRQGMPTLIRHTPSMKWLTMFEPY